MDSAGRRDSTIARQHTFGHIDCPGCESLRQDMLQGAGIAATDTFQQAAAAWMESFILAGNLDCARFVSPRTLRDYRDYISTLSKFFDSAPLNKIHEGTLRQYQIDRSLETVATRVNQELGVLRRILRAGGAWTEAMEQKYRPLQVSNPDVPRAMSPEEEERFREFAASRRRWQLAYWYCLVALETTCTSCEMRGLHIGDVNVYERVLMVRAAHAKNQFRIRTIPLSEQALWALDRIYQRARGLGSINPSDYIFPFCVARNVWDPRRPMTESGIRRSFEAIREGAGVPWLRIHDLRHCCITRMAESGEPIANIMAVAGHVSPRMTRHYTQISESAKRKTVIKVFDSRPMRPRAVTAG